MHPALVRYVLDSILGSDVLSLALRLDNFGGARPQEQLAYSL